MTAFRRFPALLCALAIILALSLPVCAAEGGDPVREIVQQMLNYFNHHQTAAKTDIERLLSQIEAIDLEQAALWRSIFEYWFYATEDMPKNEIRLPDDLPQDDSLCIVVLGYALAADGNIRPELNGRLTLALDAANQYPNAYILCTGGGTASGNPDATEAGEMSKWLRRQGVDRKRIIVEDESTHTVENAKYGIDLLTRRYPQVRQLVLVSSDYHLTRTSTLFHAKALHAAAETGSDPITIAACLGYDAGHEGGAEDPLDQTAHLARVCGFEYRRDSAPDLSRLTDISVQGNTVLETGVTPELTVTAHYDTNFSRDVTDACSFSAIDPEDARTQTLTVTYLENGTQITANLEIRRPVTETEPPATVPSEPLPPEEAAVSSQKTVPSPWLLAVILFPAVLLLFHRKKK